MKTRVYIYSFILIGLLFPGCDTDRNHPGWDYFPDMFYSTAYETYSSNPYFSDGKTMREPVPGTISREIVPFGYDPDLKSRVRAGEELKNPLPESTESIERGKIAYNTFCIGCHGPAGEGDGQLFTSGLYPLKPRAVSGKTAAPLKDGEIYHTITLGFGSMGPHGSQVRPDDRWKIIMYIRQLQKDAGVSN